MVEVVDAAPKIVVPQLKPRREVERVITLPPWLPSFCMSVRHTAFPRVDPMQPISNSYERASHLRKHGSPFPFDVDCISLPKQVRECLKSLNELAGTKFNDIQQLPHRPPTLVQQTMIKHVDQCITENGATPTDMNANQAISDLMRSFTPYDGTPSHLTEFCFEKIKILQSSVKPKKLLDLLPNHVKPFVQDFHHHVERDPNKVRCELAEDPSAMPLQPYWDPTLRNDTDARMKLFRRMHQIGLLDLQPVIRAKAGLFFVKKKDPKWIRMIVDARQANFQHRRPPVTRLGSSTVMCDLRQAPCTNLEKPDNGWAREMDVSDCFYQFRLVEAAAWFGFDNPLKNSEWHAAGFEFGEVYDYNLGRYRSSDPDEFLFPCVAAMSMGWSWALFFAQVTISSIVRTSAPDPRAELQERLPCPQMSDFSTITSTYVDNVTVFGNSFDDVSHRCEKIDAAFRQLDIPVVWTQSQPVRELECVGCEVNFDKGYIKNKSHRIWRTYLAGLELSRRKRVRAELVEIWLGHATSLVRLKPCLLSCFEHIYRFVDQGRGRRIPLWPSVQKEIRLASNLLWLTRVNLRSQIVNQVDAGDSADFGYALMTMSAPDYEILRAIKHRERWRYIPFPKQIQEALDRDDPSAIAFFLASHGGSVDEAHNISQISKGHSRYGLGISTEYGRWLQNILEQGDWIKTSAINSQRKAKHRDRVDLDLPALVEPIHAHLVNPHKYKLLWAKRWRDPSRHINEKEMTVAVSSLKRTARVASLAHSTKLTLSDSLVSIAALEKGRSSSFALNRLCKQAAAFQAGLDIHWRLRHVETSRNVSDEPSRWFEKHRDPHIQWINFPNKKGKALLELDRCINPVPYHPPGLCVELQDNDSIVEQFLTDNSCMHTNVADEQKSECEGCASSQASCSLANKPSLAAERSAARHGMIEIFSGSESLSRSVEEKGMQVLGSVDIKKGSKFDLTLSRVQNALINFVLLSHVAYIHFGTPCTVFSIARKGLRNLEKARLKERISLELAFLTAKMIELCQARGIHWSIENPMSSMLWELPIIKRLMLRSDIYKVDFPMCAYGEPYKKMTHLVTSYPPLCSLQRHCHHIRHETQLSGKVQITDKEGFRRHVNRTELAGAYPQNLAETWTSLLEPLLRPCHVEKINTTTDRPLEHFLEHEQPSQTGSFHDKLPLFHTIYRDLPSIQQCIVFGQDSQAVKAQKRKKQERNRPKLERAWEKILKT